MLQGFKKMKAKNVPPEEYVYVMVDIEDSISRRYTYLLSVLAKMFEIEIKDLKGKSRNYPMPVYRSMAWNVMRKDGFSTNQIAKVSHRDHSTIITMTKNLNDSMRFDKKLLREYEIFESNITKDFEDITIFNQNNYAEFKKDFE